MAITTGSDRGVLHLAPPLDEGPAETRAAPPIPPRSRAGRLTRRPGERHESWPVPADGSLDQVLEAARERRLEASTAAAILLERRWVVEHLEGLGLGEAVGSLDLRAAEIAVSCSMWSASAGYLRYLTFGNAEVTPNPDALALPARLSDRLRRCWPVALDARQLEPALNWEMAAVIDGLSTTEWALREALALVADRTR